MNYRHAYHAGNFADVLKHVILARVITYLKRKPQPFRVIDTHAGAGLYDMTGVEAGKTGEWHEGIGRLYDADLPAPIADLLEAYLGAVASVNASGTLASYPGSPLIAHHLLRPGDHLVANELHLEDFEHLKAALHRVPGAKALNLDAWVALKSLLPPVERRGIILIDPPFEQTGEFAQLTQSIADATRRFATGVFMVWYPVKQEGAADRFVQSLKDLPQLKLIDVRLRVAAPFAGLGLTETGVAVINPPYSLMDELALLMPFLTETLGDGHGASFRLASTGI